MFTNVKLRRHVAAVALGAWAVGACLNSTAPPGLIVYVVNQSEQLITFSWNSSSSTGERSITACTEVGQGFSRGESVHFEIVSGSVRLTKDVDVSASSAQPATHLVEVDRAGGIVDLGAAAVPATPC
jgi:hypothetical protein